MRLFAVLVLVMAVLPMRLPAQKRCGTVEYMQLQRQRGKIRQTDAQFEQWLNTRARSFLRQQQARQQTGPYRIPVVVHVIHNGEPIGTGTNLSEEQILSQIEVINKDFNRLNNDRFSTPAEFAAVAGSMDIEFVLALRDPFGLPTSGIVRVNGGRTSWSVSLESEFKALSYWPSDQYLNIWVLNLSGGFVGYAQFPVSDLPGLEEYQDGIAETDGIVIDYQAFGSVDYGSFDLNPAFNKGRTLTHELGHFFGLRHIWGDATCGTDYVDDTPHQRSETLGCPVHPATTTCTATVNKMFQNYLDYTDDLCMNLFTIGQVERMQLILENPEIPRRNSLLTSPGLLPPDCSEPNVAIIDQLKPGAVTCNPQPEVRIRIRSLSCETITSLQTSFRTSSADPVFRTHTALNLPSGGTTELNVGSLPLQPGINDIEVAVTEINDTPVSASANNVYTTRILLDTSTDRIPLREQFNTLTWPVINPSYGTEWSLSETNFSQSASFRAFDATDGPNESWLATPVLDFSHTDKASMFFDLSYAYNGTDNDRLRILVSPDCGDTYVPLSPPFDRSGLSLANTLSATLWLPENEYQWNRRNFINLNTLAGLATARIAFVLTNRQGNNLYIDNVEFYLSDDPNPLLLSGGPFAVYWNNPNEVRVTFNLEERTPVFIEILDMTARRIASAQLNDVLNQTYTITTGTAGEGLYLFRAHIHGKRYAVKFFITP